MFAIIKKTIIVFRNVDDAETNHEYISTHGVRRYQIVVIPERILIHSAKILTK